MRKLTITLALAAFVFGMPAQAETFFRTGTIERTLSGKLYGGCMVLLSTIIGNGCPTTGWVSLDCDAELTDPGAGERHYASALIAASLAKQVSIRIDNGLRINGHCVAQRIDVIFP
jgi:hypothetical protein